MYNTEESKNIKKSLYFVLICAFPYIKTFNKNTKLLHKD